jgi:hypothetical protein
MKYILMMNGSQKGWATFCSWPKEDLQGHIRFMVDFCKELKQEGSLLAAEGLATPDQARIVRAGGKHGAPITDGAFAETKEFLAGYWIVEVDSPEKAYSIAARASAAPGRGGAPMNMPIEVRQIMSGPPEEFV